MKIIADTHLHVYPCYDEELAVHNLFDNLTKIAPDAVKVAFLAERSDCSWYQDIKQAGTLSGGVTVETIGNENVLILRKEDACLYLFPGRQIVASERVEILSLMADVAGLDGMSSDRIVEDVISGGGFPVLSWAPGKWMFSRKEKVKKLIGMSEQGTLLLGDTTLRPILWGEPLLMRFARSKGIATVAGSDPLPFADEEKYMGCYATVFDAPFDEKHPVSSMKAALTTSGSVITSIGRRCGPFEVFLRLVKNARSKL
ncbi:MAG: hypothetical protein KAH23_03015 [Kiritimatiellae bacterium]|nr:hypothetical protein [Kiritimatiellia bacterium]